jgi:hypothetical protein
MGMGIKYQTIGSENGVFVVKGEFDTQKEALNLANKLNSEQNNFYYDWKKVDTDKKSVKIKI